MTADHTTGSFVPDDRFDIPELLDGAFQFLIFGITRLQILSRIVFRRQKICCVFLFDYHTRPHSAKASNPPRSEMNALAVSTISS